MRVYKLEMFGSSCTFDKMDDLLSEVKVALDEDDDGEIVITSFETTEEYYKQLPEFQGW